MPPFTTETSAVARRKRDYATEKRAERERAAAATEHDQFMRDLRGDHDGPASYAWLPPADSTPTAAEVASWED